MSSLPKYIILESEIINTYDNRYVYSDDSEEISDKMSFIIQAFKDEINEMINKGYEPNGSIINIPFKVRNEDESEQKYIKLIQAMTYKKNKDIFKI